MPVNEVGSSPQPQRPQFGRGCAIAPEDTALCYPGHILATFAELDADLIRLRTREGMAIARAKGRLRGKQPKLSDKQQKELRRMHDTGDYLISDLAELFSVAARPSTVPSSGKGPPNSLGETPPLSSESHRFWRPLARH